nr:MAG TPA: hypothetical protein [Caudoviricetes sp.]
MTSFADNGRYKPISRVTLLLDDEKSLTAGDDTGMEITASCPHATQAMVNALLQKMKGYQYQAYEAGAANIDPAAELGDGVNVGGLYSPISRIADDGRGYADISSPGELEMEDEYPSGGYITKEFNRKLAETRSAITKTSKEILLKVEGIDGRVTSLSTSIDGIRSEVSGKIDGKSAQSMIDQSLKGITMSASSGADGTTFKLMANGAELSTQTFDLHVKSVNIDGALTIGQLPNTVAQTSQIPTHTSQLTNNSGYQTEQGVTQIINGVVTTDYIYALGVEANAVRGSTVAIKNNGGNTVGGITTTWTESGSDGIAIISTTGLKIGAQTNLFLSAGSGGSITLKNGNMIMSGLALCLSPQSYGYGAPSGAGAAGQIYVQLRQ